MSGCGHPPARRPPFTYNPSQIRVFFGGIELHGFASGVFVEVERGDELQVVPAKPCGGKVTLTLHGKLL